MENEIATSVDMRRDYAGMQTDRNAGTRVVDIATKYGVSEVTVYHRTKPSGKAKSNGSRSKRVAYVASINWTKVQNERTEGAELKDLSKKYGVSMSVISNHTKPTPRSTSKRVHWTQTPGGKKRMAERHNANGSGSRTTLRIIPENLETPGSIREALAQIAVALRTVVQSFEEVNGQLDDVRETIGEV